MWFSSLRALVGDAVLGQLFFQGVAGDAEDSRGVALVVAAALHDVADDGVFGFADDEVVEAGDALVVVFVQGVVFGDAVLNGGTDGQRGHGLPGFSGE